MDERELTSFNPTLIQFKRNWIRQNILCNEKFQSHADSIQTIFPKKQHISEKWFQSHADSIQTVIYFMRRK